MFVFSIIFLLQVFSLALASTRAPSDAHVLDLEIHEKSSNEGFVANENGDITTKSEPEPEPEPEPDNNFSLTIGTNTYFEIPDPPSQPKHVENETASNIITNKVNVYKPSDITADLLEWEAPIWFQKNAPYYLSGYDEDGRPVWILEWGKYPIRELTLLEDDQAKIFDKYLQQLAGRIIKSITDQNLTEIEEKTIAIIDLDELDLYKIAHPKSLLVIVKLFTAFQELIFKYVETGMVINVNFVAERVINLLRPVLGRSFENLEFYGTNSAKWKPQLLRRVPKDALPSFYGGSSDFAPLKVFG